MANPWDRDPVVSGNPWDEDAVIEAAPVNSAPRNTTAGQKKPTNGNKPDFSDVSARVDGTAQTRQSRRTAKIRAQAEGEAHRARIDYERMQDGPGFLAGAGYSFAQTGQGLKQLGNDAVMVGSSNIANVADGIGLNRLAGIVRQNVTLPAYRRGKQYQSETRGMREDMEPTQGSVAGQAGNILGGVVQSLAIPGGGGAVRQGVTNALVGAAQPVTSNRERAANATIGAALGAGLKGIGGASARAGQSANTAIGTSKRAAIDAAKRAGIPLHASQVVDSKSAKTIASVASGLPFSGAGKAAGQQQAAFNRAVSRTFGADADDLGDDVMRSAQQSISKKFEDVYSRNDVPLTPSAIRQLVKVEQDVAGRLTKDDAKIVSNQLDKIIDEAAATGVLSGQKYQALRSQIMKAEGADKVGTAVKELRNVLDDIAAAAVGPADAAVLKQVRGQWANLRITQDALKQVSGASGNVRPASLFPLVGRKGSTKEMRELAKVGQLIKDPIPDSGTAGRLLTAGGLIGGTTGGVSGLATVGGAIASGATAGRIANSNRLANFLVSKNRGNTRKVTGNALAGSARYTAIPSSRKEDKP